MHPRSLKSLLLLAVAASALLAPRLHAQPAPAAPTPPAAPAAATPGAPVPGTPAAPGAARGGRGAANPQPYGYQVPTEAGHRTNWPDRLEWDLADLKVFAEANKALPPPAPGENRVVFLGDSITENWQRSFSWLFPNKTNYIGRGRTSETTQQMLLRFRQDVIDLKPKVVVILAGTNDIAGNLGRSTDKMITDNYISMIDLASINKIKVVFCSIMPTTRYFWQPSITDGGARAVQINKWLKAYAATRPGEVYYVDIHTPMVGPDGTSMNPALSSDGTHPNNQGYALISPTVERAIFDALGLPKNTPLTVQGQPPAGRGGRGAGAPGAAPGAAPAQNPAAKQ